MTMDIPKDVCRSVGGLYIDGVISLNEARKMLTLAPMKGGDELFYGEKKHELSRMTMPLNAKASAAAPYHKHNHYRGPHVHDSYPAHIHEPQGDLAGVYSFTANASVGDEDAGEADEGLGLRVVVGPGQGVFTPEQAQLVKAKVADMVDRHTDGYIEGVGAPTKTISAGDEDAAMPSVPTDVMLQPVRFSQQSVADAFRRALPGRKIAFGLKPNPHCDVQVLIVDDYYTALTREHWDAVMKAAKGPTGHKYIPNRYDCDNFGVQFAGWVGHEYSISMGVIIDGSGRHAYNCVLEAQPDGSVNVDWLEPQTDRIVRLGSNHHIMKTADWILLA